MYWELSDEQADFAAALRGWLQRHASFGQVRSGQESGDTADFDHRFDSEGWFGVGSPEELGGNGGGMVELALTAEELGSCAAPSSRWLGTMLAVPALAAAPDAAKALFADGVTTVLATGSGEIPGSRIRAYVTGERLDGVVPLVIGGDLAQRFVVPAESADGELGLFLVDADAAGVERTPRKLLDRSRSAADVRLTSAAATRLELDRADAGGVLQQIADRAAVLVAAGALGCSARMLDLCVEYSLQRKQFGVPIGSFQAVKHAASTMLVGVEAARSIVLYAAAALDQSDVVPLADARLAAAAAKAQVTASASAAADSALTIHGAIGYTWEHDLQLLYKRAKLDVRLFGTPARWNERIAAALELVPQAN